MRPAPFSLFPLGLLVAGLAACAPGERTVQGDCQPLFGGDVCTWGTMTGDDLTAFGATVPVASIENAPADGEMVFPPKILGAIALPAEVAAATGFDHVSLNWEPHGHPPGPYLTPHFDFHFYTIDPDAVMAIDCADVSKPATLPAAYTLPDIEIPGLGTLVGLCVPTMGMHAMPEAEMQQTAPFGATMIVGYDAQTPVFMEPMISRARLLEARSFTLDVPAMPAGGNVTWPTSFAAEYDATARTYRFVFSGFPTE